ncbi:hypothetical protein V5N11_033119 [Cardamine amara subsp. amara]|uniref:Uncharacterized protein n=1 Tax=Cardamine amara subsp. amara TaxID=228776 RepID=A0ABD1B0K8_CARAN
MGYPYWWGGRRRGCINSGRGRGNQAGRGSGPPLAAAPAQVNSVAVNKVVTNADRVGLTSLNDTQWRTLVAMLNERKASSSETLTGLHYEDADWSG